MDDPNDNLSSNKSTRRLYYVIHRIDDFIDEYLEKVSNPKPCFILEKNNNI